MNTIRRAVVRIDDLRTTRFPARGQVIPETGVAIVGDLQRTFKPNHRIFKTEYDRNAVNIVLWVPDGVDPQSGYRIDGNHCATYAMQNNDFHDHDVVVILGGSEVDAARAFTTLNTREAVDPISMFKNSLTAGGEEEAAIAMVLDALGLHFGAGPGRYRLHAVKSVRQVYKAGEKRKSGAGGRLLLRTLGVLTEAYEGNSRAYPGTWITAIGELILRHGDRIEDSVFAEALAETPIPRLNNRIRASNDAHGGINGRVRVFADIYNSRKRGRNRIVVPAT